MSGLDLLFSYSPNSEAVHQVALACLLKDRAIARSLGLTGTPKNTFIESNGRLFDITVEMEDGSVSHVELKVNAILGDDQVERQRNFLESNRAEMIYILLGTQQFMSPAQMHLEDWERSGQHEISFSDDGVLIVGAKARLYETSPKRLSLENLISALSKAASDIEQPAIQDLAAAYRLCLENIRKTFTSFFTTPVAFWNEASWIGFYDFARVTRFPSACLDSRFGVLHFTFEHHPLWCRNLAVDDFIEYHASLDAGIGEFHFMMSVIGDYDADDATHVRKQFRKLLQVSAEKHGLTLRWTPQHAGQVMTIATLAVCDLYQKDMQAFGWRQCMAAVQSATSAISDAAAGLRSLRA